MKLLNSPSNICPHTTITILLFFHCIYFLCGTLHKLRYYYLSFSCEMCTTSYRLLASWAWNLSCFIHNLFLALNTGLECFQ